MRHLTLALRTALALRTMALCLTLAACGSLPRSGPNVEDVLAEAAPAAGPAPFVLLDVTPDLVEQMRRAPPPPSPAFADTPARSGEVFAPGDRVAVTLFEPTGGGLFGGGPIADGGPMRALPPQVVDARGRIRVPYAGEIAVAGLDPGTAARRIEEALVGQAIEPQAMVALAGSVRSGVTVLGDAVAGGARVPFAGADERLLDVIAAAGGFSRPLHDTLVRLTRDADAAEIRADALLADPKSNVRVHPGDVVAVTHRPRRFVLLGAVQAPAQVEFGQSRLMLAEALARGSGLSNERGNPEGVFLLRRERAATLAALNVPATAETPVVYRADLTRPSGLFAAQAFEVADGDVLFVANAEVTPVEQVLRLVGLILGPLNTAILLGNAFD